MTHIHIEILIPFLTVKDVEDVKDVKGHNCDDDDDEDGGWRMEMGKMIRWDFASFKMGHCLFHWDD